MSSRVVMDHSSNTEMIVDDEEEIDQETPILDQLLKIDDMVKRQRQLCRMLIFNRVQTQQEVLVAMVDFTDQYSSDPYKRSRFSYASTVECFVQLDRGTLQLIWDAGSSSKNCKETVR